MKLCLVCNFQFEDEQELCPKDQSRLVSIGKDPLIGKLLFDRYRIDSLIAKGSMGVIYKAIQANIGQAVAVKVMHSHLVTDDDSLKRYHKEAKAVSRLNHPNIITIYDFGVLATGQPYIVTDLLAGKSLSNVLKNQGQLTIQQMLNVFQQVCSALSEAHAHGVVHRDIKPENIMLNVEPESQSMHVKILDFGIATFLQEGEDTLGKITKTGTVCGSPFYMSPEQCQGTKVDKRSDIYSLGIVLFECLVGKLPFNSQDIYGMLSLQIKEPSPRLSKMRPDLSFPPQLEMVVAKALAKDPSARFQSIEEFWQALSSACGMKLLPLVLAPEATSTQIVSPDTASITNHSDKSDNNNNNIAGSIGDLQKKIQSSSADLYKKTKYKDATLLRQKKLGLALACYDQALSLIHTWFPPMLTLCCTALLLWVMTNESLLHSVIKTHNDVHYSRNLQYQSIELMIAQGRIEEARKILEKKKQAGKLSINDKSDLNLIYIKLASQKAKAKQFREALEFLELMSPEAKKQIEVKIMQK